MTNICPYCKKDTGKEIKRKITCKECGNTIYVRQGKAVTEREKDILDWQWYMNFLVPDISEVRSKVEEELTKRFDMQPSSHDLIWGMFNYVASRLRTPRDLSTIYENMATFLESEGKDKQAEQLKRDALKMRIVDFKNSSFDYRIKIENKDDDFVCQACKKTNKKIMKLDDAIKEPPVPFIACENKKCRCFVDFISDYELQNQGKDNQSNEIVITLKTDKKENKSLSSFIYKLFKNK